jgi:hypothetical protein
VLTGNNPPPPHKPQGVPSSPKLLGVLTATQTQQGQPKHPSRVDPAAPGKQALTQPNPAAQFSSSTTGRSPSDSCSREKARARLTCGATGVHAARIGPVCESCKETA